MKGKTVLAPGMTKVTDWVGCTVETIVDLRNGSTAIPAGTVASVTYARSGLTLLSEPCAHCGVSVYITRVAASSVRLVARAASAAARAGERS